MKKRIRIGRCLGILSLFILYLIGINSVAYADKPVYAIGHITMLTGVYGPTMKGNNEGFLDAIDSVNKYWNLPVTLKAVWVDGQSNPTKSLSAGKKMVAQHNPVILIDDTTPTASAMKGFCIKQKIPSIIGGGSDPLWTLPSWTFSAIPPYQNQLGAWVDYYLKHLWPKKGLKRAPNFAWLTWDHAAGRASITDKVKAYIKSKGINIVRGDGEFVPAAPTSVGAQILRLKKNKVDFTYGLLFHTAAVAVLTDADKHGVIDDIDFHILTPRPVGLIEQVGDLTRNVYSATYTWNWETVKKKAPRVVEAYKTNNRSINKSMYRDGFSWALIAAEAIRMAIKDVGPNNVTGESCYKALKRMKNYDRGGIGCPVTFGEKKRYGFDSIIFQRLNDKRLNVVGEFPTPNLTKFEF